MGRFQPADGSSANVRNRRTAVSASPIGNFRSPPSEASASISRRSAFRPKTVDVKTISAVRNSWSGSYQPTLRHSTMDFSSASPISKVDQGRGRAATNFINLQGTTRHPGDVLVRDEVTCRRSFDGRPSGAVGRPDRNPARQNNLPRHFQFSRAPFEEDGAIAFDRCLRLA